MALPSPTATTAERERLLALARRLEEGLEEIDKGIVLREQSLAEIADDTGASESDRVKASSAILSSQAKRADRLTSELSATRRALRQLPTEGDPETVRALAAKGAITTVTDTQRIWGGRFVTGDDRKPVDLRRWDEALYDDMPESDRPL